MAAAAAADDSEMKASREEAAPARMPCHHDLAPTNNITFHEFLKMYKFHLPKYQFYTKRSSKEQHYGTFSNFKISVSAVQQQNQ